MIKCISIDVAAWVTFEVLVGARGARGLPLQNDLGTMSFYMFQKEPTTWHTDVVTTEPLDPENMIFGYMFDDFYILKISIF